MIPLEEVQAFWNANPCGSVTSRSADRREFYREVEQQRYLFEPHIPVIATFDRFRGADVLEVGCGLATDGVQFARAGARYTAVELSPDVAVLARENFRLQGLEGSFYACDAASLPFEDESFDHVYSFGVIHHAADPDGIMREIHRVLRPGGSCCVMLYNRNSINYRVEILIMRRLFRLCLFPRFMPALISALTGLDRGKLEAHRKILVSGARMTPERWLSINTDGPLCPLSRVYDERQVRKVFEQFQDVETAVWYFDARHWPGVSRLLPLRACQWIGRRWGWHRIVYGTKPFLRAQRTVAAVAN